MGKSIFDSKEFKAEIILSVLLEQNFQSRIERAKELQEESNEIFMPENELNVGKLMGKLLAQNSELASIYTQLDKIKELRNQTKY